MQQAWMAALVVLALAVAGSAVAQPSAGSSAAAAAPPAVASAAVHRTLRLPLPQMDTLPAPTEPEVFAGYPAAPPFTVVSRKPELPLYPCSMCHNLQQLNTRVRKFVVAPPPTGAPHAGVLRHGKGQMWCLDCHLAKDREWLHTLDGSKLDFDESPRLCGQCHGARYRDWVFGGHGKRVAGWTGARQLYACTHCHDPHAPQIPRGAASKPPPVRAGLQPMTLAREHTLPPWQSAPEGKTIGPPSKP